MKIARNFSIAMTLVCVACNACAGGAVERGIFDSPALGVKKAYRIYLPEGYTNGNQRYPVIYLLHGWGVTEDAWVSPDLDLPRAADAMRLHSIVVMPDGDRSFYANFVTQPDYEQCLKEVNPRKNRNEKREDYCVRRANYEDYIVYDLVKFVDSKYRTVATRQGRALTGESAGGAGAMQIAMRHKEVFSSAASHSGGVARLYEGPRPYDRTKVKLRSDFSSYPPGMQELIPIFGTNIKTWRSYDPPTLAEGLRDGDLALYFDCGQQDETGGYEMARYLHDRLTELGISHDFKPVPGHHNDEFFKQRMKFSLAFHVAQFTAAGVYPTK